MYDSSGSVNTYSVELLAQVNLKEINSSAYFPLKYQIHVIKEFDEN